jgi:hypothetical protein
MIINLWSTPRTGSNWYAEFLFTNLKKTNNKTQIFHQYLNYFHFINYSKSNHGDWLYEYDKNCTYPNFEYDFLKKSITFQHKLGKRTRDPKVEESHRIHILDNHDQNKFPLILHNHVMPMSEKSYTYLFNKANKNIFLYRENLVDQLSSYALAYSSTIWKPKSNLKVLQNVKTDKNVIKNLYDRILHWHSLDKTNCDVVKYEDIKFSDYPNIKITKQNKVKPFDQLHIETQTYILELNDNFLRTKIEKNFLLWQQ